MDEQARYDKLDLPFYRSEVAPVLPPVVLDFHAHTWVQEPPESTDPHQRYMVTMTEYPAEQLLADSRKVFPDREYRSVCFGNPTPSADTRQTNLYVSEAAQGKPLYPLLVTGRDMEPREELDRRIREDGFFGFKVFLNWTGDDYGCVTIEDMIGPAEMALANELKLIVLLHVPRSGRLADPEVQRGVQALSKDYPDAAIVLAHCGRAYLPDEMARSIDSVVDLPNVYLDTAMVMDPTVLQIVFDNIDSSRVLFATDFPVAAMRGRRVYLMDHWVDVVLEGHPASAYRVAGDNMRATYMASEIVLAIRRAGEMAGLPKRQIQDIFFVNGMQLLERVMDGRQLTRKARGS